MIKYSVENVTSSADLGKIRDDWELIYREDPHAQVYISWLWFNGWIEHTKSEWFVVSVKNDVDGKCVALLPLSVVSYKVIGISLLKKLEFAGKPVGVYSGFLCLPEHEAAIQAIADFIRNDHSWDAISMKWVKDVRVELFVQTFDNSQFSVRIIESLPSLQIHLPDDYATFASSFMGRNTRRRVKEKINILHNDPHLNLRVADEQTIVEDIEAFCTLWLQHWNRPQEKEWHSHMMHWLYQNNRLRLTTLCYDTKPVAALACIVEPESETYNAYITAFDPDYANISPGIILFVKSIEHAIENNYTYYDFTVGMDEYKIRFGPKQIKTFSFSVKRKRFITTLFIAVAKQLKRLYR